MMARTLSEAATLCKLVATPTHAVILFELGAGPRDTTALGAATGCSQPYVSHGLTLLRLAGLVESTVAGQRRVHSLTAGGLLVAEGLEKLSAD